MKVLYIDGVGPFGGASRSLYEAINAMPKETVEPYFVAAEGTALDFYRRRAVDTIATRGLTRFDNTKYSYYRGVRWLVVLRELFHLPFTIAALLRAKRRWQYVDVIHANEITEIIPLILAKRLFKAPAIIHVRSLQRQDRYSKRCSWLTRRLKNVDAVVAIDQNVRATLPDDLNVEVIHNSFTPKKSPISDPAIVDKLDRLRPTSLKVGFVGNLHQSKGLMDLVEAAKIVNAAGEDVDFLVVGGVTIPDRGIRAMLLNQLGLAQNLQVKLADRVREYNLGSVFHLTGPTNDIQSVYEKLDVLAFPSHLDSPGRPVFEAAFSCVPSIVGVKDPKDDTLIHGETGLAFPGGDVDALAGAILHFARNREEAKRMGANAKQLAERNFDPATNARKILGVYTKVIGRGSAR